MLDMPDVPATVIAERIGSTGSIPWFRDNVRRLRPEQGPVDPADRIIWLPSHAAQCDLWLPPKKSGSRTAASRCGPVAPINRRRPFVFRR